MMIEQIHIYESKHFYGLGSKNKIMFEPLKQHTQDQSLNMFRISFLFS